MGMGPPSVGGACSTVGREYYPKAPIAFIGAFPLHWRHLHYASPKTSWGANHIHRRQKPRSAHFPFHVANSIRFGVVDENGARGRVVNTRTQKPKICDPTFAFTLCPRYPILPLFSTHTSGILMHHSYAMPTKFAMALASKVELFSNNIATSLGAHTKADEILYYRLQEFQQMVIGGAAFEEALYAYHGMDLTAEQTTALRIIEKSTKPWLLGHIGGVLIDRLKSAKDKDVVLAAQILMDDIMKTAPSDGTGVDKATAKRLIVKLADFQK